MTPLVLAAAEEVLAAGGLAALDQGDVIRAGYSPDGMILFFKKLERLSGSNGLPAFLSTHPATPERIRRLEALKTLPQSAQSPR